MFDLGNELRTLEAMTVGALRERFRELVGEETRSFHKRYLVRRIAWHLQAKRYGGLSERAKIRAAQLADESFLRTSRPRGAVVPATASDPRRTTVLPFAPSIDPRLPLPGTCISRPYHGENVTVRVLDVGFDYRGVRFKSLSAVAKAITGSHMSGHAFFGLRKRGKK